MADPVADLGPYVYVMNPYVPVLLPGNVGPAGPPNFRWDFAQALIAAPGLPASGGPPNPAFHDEMYGLRLQEAEVQAYPGQMYFRGSERYVARALRIPYIYYKASATLGGGVALVREHLLIGYEGSGGGF
jgi:hypothetical protein